MTDAERVLRLLNNARVPQTDLAFVLGLSTRKVQSAIVELRLEGKPVLSDGDGIRLAETADEADACTDTLRRRLVTQYRTYRALRRTARAMRVREDAAARATLWHNPTFGLDECLTPGCWCRVGSLESRVHGAAS